LHPSPLPPLCRSTWDRICRDQCGGVPGTGPICA